MAVAFGSSSNTTYATRTNTTVTAPASISNGNLLLALIFVGQAGGTAPTISSAPSGWTQIGSEITVNDAFFAARIRAYYKVASSESGDYTWNHSSCSSQGIVVRYTGNDTTNPINVSSSNSGSPANSTRTATGVTTTVNDCMLAYSGFDWGSSSNETPPTGFTERHDGTIVYWADALQASAGASGNKTNTCNSASGEPRGCYLIAIAPAATAQIIAADAGSYSVTGTAADLEIGRVVAADSGSYSVTGTDATLLRTGLIAANSGAYSVIGDVANLARSRLFAADGGSYLVSGSDATLILGKEIPADAGSYSVSGAAAGLLATRKIAADAGAYLITGTVADLHRAFIFAADGGSYAVTGSDATLSSGKGMIAESGSYSVTGSDAGFLFSHRIAAESGSYSVSGVAASLNKGQTVIASSGSYAINGTAANFLRTYMLTAATAAYTVSGADATLIHDDGSGSGGDDGSGLWFLRRRRRQ